jgi:signal transduction histidine kinase
MQTAITRTSGPGRVLLVDDHPAVRRVLRSLLEEVGGWQVVGEADSGEAAIPLVEQLTPDVVLMDCRMPGAGGVAATREIVNRWPEVAVVAHTAYADETYVREMVAAGARGYVLKGDVPAAVLEALSAARQGQARLSAAVTGPVMEDLRELYEAAVNRSKELEAESADLSSTVARLEEVDRLKDEFVAVASHELRTPLASVYGAAITLKEHDLDPQTRDAMLDVIFHESDRLARIVNDVLWASRLESGSLRTTVESVDAASLAEEVVVDARPRLPTGCSLELISPPGLPPAAADPEKLRRVLVNLVDNAVKYSPDGGRIDVELAASDGQVRFAVRDHGLGIPESEQERIFDKFHRLDPYLQRGVSGTGLGLYICRELVHQMNGRIWVESSAGEGSTFSFELPAAS